MKKILLLSMVSLSTLGLFAQKSSTKSSMFKKTLNSEKKITPSESSNFTLSNKKTAKKTRSIPFWSDNFSSGTANSLPTGWTATSVVGTGTWKWANAASTSQFSIGAINSTTASNGWMIYDADAIHTASGGASAVDGYLTSPSVNCSTHPTVMLRFQQHYTRFTDSCTIFVSNNGGTSWTPFSVEPNNSLSPNSSLPSNPHNYYLNITSIAGGQANVQIRFRQGTLAAGAYSWLIDDVSLSELDSVDASITKSFITYEGSGGLASYVSIPSSLSDSIGFVTLLSNIGSNSLTSVPLSAITSNTTLQNSQTTTYASLPLNAKDSIINFPNAYLPTTVGSYSTGFAVNAPSDAVAFNNIDSCFHSISDSIFSQNTGSLSGFYSHRPANGANPEFSIWHGTLFDIPAGKSDTVSAVYACFSSSTTVNSKMKARIYKFDGSANPPSWLEIGTGSNIKTLTANNISTSSALRFARFEIPFSNDAILTQGQYAVIMDPSDVTSTQTVVIYSSESPAVDFFTTGVRDDVEFASAGLPSAAASTPMIQMCFGRKNLTFPESVSDLSNITSTVSPNPATSDVTFALNLKESAKNVTIEISNALGQVVKTSKVGSIAANTTSNTTISVADLSAGMYIYTINADGQKTSNKLMVK